jgi:hypothetical protein
VRIGVEALGDTHELYRFQSVDQVVFSVSLTLDIGTLAWAPLTVVEGRQPLALQGLIHRHLAVPVTIPT